VFLKAFFFLVASAATAAPSLELNARYHATTTFLNTIDSSALIAYPLAENIFIEGGARIAFSRLDFESFEYKAEISTRLWGFLKPSIRFQQDFLFSDTLSLSHFLFAVRLEGRPFSWLNIFITPAWYKRFTHLNKVAFFPTVRSSYTEHDFAGAIGVEAGDENWKAITQIATFEEISIYNLNNPFAELRLIHPISGIEWSAFFRYQILLGFGRLDSFLAGVGVQYGL
jgi:hypothetical protein